MEQSDLVYACCLNRIFNYKCLEARRLIEHFPSIGELFELSRNGLTEIFGEKSHYPDEILNQSHTRKAIEDVEWADKHNISIIYIKDREYPYRLKECEDAPIILYYKGSADMNVERAVSIVGTRKATPYGRETCERILEEFSHLSPPPLIISGLAFGIDITAHKKALELGLESIGVMATGLDEIYPRQHRNIAAQMVSKGGIISDFPKETPPLKLNFIRRNRIIAGISDATILIESREEGGGMVSAKMAYSFSREVFALPGKITDPYSKGCNLLIKENIAEAITDSNSISVSLGWERVESKNKINKKMLIFESDNEIKRKILVALSSYLSFDVNDLFEISGATLAELNLNIVELALEGRIKEDADGRYSIA